MTSKNRFRLLALLTVLGFAVAAWAATWSSSDQWATYQLGNYTIYNNIWGSGAGSQTLYVNTSSSSAPNWWVTANHPNTGGIKSYPNAKYAVNLPRALSGISSVPSSWSVSRPNTGAYNSAYDVWLNGYSWEIMIWINWYGAVGPLGSQQASNQSIAGATWNVYRGNNGSNEVVSFLRTSNTNSVSNMDVKAFLNWIVNRGWFSSSTTLTEVQAGFELTSGSGTWTTNSFSTAVNVGSSTPTPTPTPSGGGQTIANGTYRIIARHSGKALDVYGNRTANGTNVIQWRYTGANNQRWNVTHLGNGQYSIISASANKALDVSGAGTGDGTNVQIWSYGGGNNQKWTITATSGGYYRVSPVHASSKALDVNGVSTSDGANVQIWGYWGGNNQQWAFQTP